MHVTYFSLLALVGLVSATPAHVVFSRGHELDARDSAAEKSWGCDNKKLAKLGVSSVEDCFSTFKCLQPGTLKATDGNTSLQNKCRTACYCGKGRYQAQQDLASGQKKVEAGKNVVNAANAFADAGKNAKKPKT